ncbi:M67 family metallopeptidase [Phormidium yuhuli AB48]|uniref:M67 family metallopeptidase n=1 Tax=Phormidium yuhuli AB48 TaxID=2940671 RepID=A0ABY5AVN0_9CYAN|nr:M67 family metallopeptidase [Phormidium yuhuli]USR92842.1 M67 family metallopeptidase [Phormidium yuhuli AB48]
MLGISGVQLGEIGGHGEKTYPWECCGLLLGTGDGGQARVLQVWPAANAWDASTAEMFERGGDEPIRDWQTQERRYTIAPEVMLAAQKTARDRHWRILGIYHSHPNHEAVPSECDRQWAWPEYYYLIVSVAEGVARESRCWQLDEQGQFQEVPLSVESGENA